TTPAPITMMSRFTSRSYILPSPNERFWSAPVSGQSGGDVTQLLMQWSEGDRGALDALMPVVYGELRKIADAYLRRERSGHTLQPTALVHEAWLRLVRQDQPSFAHRTQFFALAAQVMRRILVDHARTVNADKRGGGAQKAPLHEAIAQF